MSKASGTGGDASFNTQEGVGCHVTWGSGWCAISSLGILLDLVCLWPQICPGIPPTRPKRRVSTTVLRILFKQLSSIFCRNKFGLMTSGPSQSPSFLQTLQQVPIKKIQIVSSRRLRKKNKPAKWRTSQAWKDLVLQKIYPQNLPPRTRPQIAISQVSRRHSKPGPAEMVRWDPFHHSKNNLSNFQAFCRTLLKEQKVTWCLYSMKKDKHIYCTPTTCSLFISQLKSLIFQSFFYHPFVHISYASNCVFQIFQTLTLKLCAARCFTSKRSKSNSVLSTVTYVSQWPVHGWGKFQWLCHDRMWGDVL